MICTLFTGHPVRRVFINIKKCGNLLFFMRKFQKKFLTLEMSVFIMIWRALKRIFFCAYINNILNSGGEKECLHLTS